MILRRRAAWLVVVLASTAACGTADDASGGASLVATTTIWADIASNVACGDDAVAIVPPGADPHAFEPSLRDRELIEGADLVVANGSGLEETLVDLLATTNANVVEMSTRVDLIDSGDEHEDGVSAADHDHAAGNPHIWHDPTRVSGALDLIGSGLIERDTDEIRRCVDAYRAELEAIDAEITRLLAPIPPALRVLVANHDSLAYFADRYDFEIVGTVLPATTTMAETNPAALQDLAELIDQRAIRRSSSTTSSRHPTRMHSPGAPGPRSSRCSSAR